MAKTKFFTKQHEQQVEQWKAKCTRYMHTFVEEQKPRWNKEAIECTEEHGLEVTGDVAAWNEIKGTV
jgi:hypothetical protein